MLCQRRLVRSHRLRDLQRTLRKRRFLERNRNSLTRQHGRKIHTLRGKRTLSSGWFEKGLYSSPPKLVQDRVFTGHHVAGKLFHSLNDYELGYGHPLTGSLLESYNRERLSLLRSKMEVAVEKG